MFLKRVCLLTFGKRRAMHAFKVELNLLLRDRWKTLIVFSLNFLGNIMQKVCVLRNCLQMKSVWMCEGRHDQACSENMKMCIPRWMIWKYNSHTGNDACLLVGKRAWASRPGTDLNSQPTTRTQLIDKSHRKTFKKSPSRPTTLL